MVQVHLCNQLVSFCDNEEFLTTLSHEDFLFQEHAYKLLCLATLSLNTTLEEASRVHSKNRAGYIDLYALSHGDKNPQDHEFVALPGTGCHLKGNTPAATQSGTMYWFEGVLVHLRLRITEPGVLRENIVWLSKYCRL